jgi:hypothetical protein
MESDHIIPPPARLSDYLTYPLSPHVVHIPYHLTEDGRGGASDPREVV